MRDPFGPIVRKQRLRGRLLGLERALLRPVRRTPPRRTQGPPNLVLVGVDTLRHDHATAERMPDVAA
ncbi:hypothetical protein GF314_05545, partial [bacterium]|nr:hypothetical protein [bacterium]